MHHVSELQWARLEQMFRNALCRELTVEERSYLKFSLQMFPLQESELQSMDELQSIIEKRSVEDDASGPAKLKAS